MVLLAVELRRSHPVDPREVEAVADAHAPLFRRVDHEKAAKRPEGLAAEKLFSFLVDDQHAPAAIAQFGGRGEPRQPGADHDGVI